MVQWRYMADLQSFNAKICYVAGGILAQDNKVLLVKHKKLGVWLSPGGHVEPEEPFHLAAEREFFEETGVKVQVYDPFVDNWEGESEYLPSPILTNLHWVARENYDARMHNPDTTERVRTQLWPRGCEQHLGYIYLVRPVGSLELQENPAEVDGIGWFDANEMDSLEMLPDTRREHLFALALTQEVAQQQ